MQCALVPLLACSLAAALPLPAQTRAPAAPATLDARMQAFLREVPETPNTELAAFFPRGGDWTWVQTMRDERGRVEGTGIWRFPGAETLRAIGADGPVCDSFDEGGGEFGPLEGRLGMYTMMNQGLWRRVRGNRFVPPEASARSPVFVEWRREEGEWVVSAFGDENVRFSHPSPRLLGRPVGAFSPDTTRVPEDAAFAPADWYTISVEWRRYTKYGLPRPIDRALLARIGVLQLVSVYVERGSDDPGLVYLPTAPGEYQPYETPLPIPCS